MAPRDKKGALDRMQEKIVSRKLLAWLTATGFTIAGLIEPNTWELVTIVYIGATAAQDITSIATDYWKNK